MKSSFRDRSQTGSVLTRRRFLFEAGRSGAVTLAVAPQVLLRAAEEAGESKTQALRPLEPVDRFNYIAGTQTFDPAYQFTEKPRLTETAEGIQELGCSVIKLNISWDKSRGPRPPRIASLRDLAANDPVLRDVLDMPFGHFLLWAYPIRKGKGDSAASDRDEEIYELGCHLLRRYSGTGKQFYIGHWEGDWEIRGRAGSKDDPTREAIDKKITWLKRRQKAIDDAKSSTPHADVGLYCYAEANLVRDAMAGRPAMANAVIPHTGIDFVSYSSYDTTNNHVADLPKVLDYIEAQLPPKPEIRGKRVWIGEYGFPAENHSPSEQDARSREVLLAGLRWGCPFVLYWEFYNNEVEKDGRQRGFWMIDDKGFKQPVYHTHRKLCAWGRDFVARALRKNGKLPPFEDYRKAAAEFLTAL